MLWLKRVDRMAPFVPSWLVRNTRDTDDKQTVLLRPGGMGDMVLLTRACRERDCNPLDFQWIGEKRNTPWLRYMRIPFLEYDSLRDFFSLFFGKHPYFTVVNTEQHHGLASLFALRLTARGGNLVGLSDNPLSERFVTRVDYTDRTIHELEIFKRLLDLAEPPPPTGSPETSFDWNPPIKDALPRLPYAVIALAGLQSPYKSASLEAWLKLVEYSAQLSQVLYLVGSPIDLRFAAKLASATTIPIVNLVGQKSLPYVFDLIRGAGHLVTVDSGLAHVADFFGVRSHVLFTHDGHKKWGPTSTGSCILQLTPYGKLQTTI